MEFNEKFKYVFIYGCLIYGGLLALVLWLLKYLNNETVGLDVNIFTTVVCLIGGCIWGAIMYKLKTRGR